MTELDHHLSERIAAKVIEKASALRNGLELEPVPGLMPLVPRQGGYGPLTDGRWEQTDYHHPAAGWGAAMSVTKFLAKEHQIVRGTAAMFRMNHNAPKGFDCPGCAWPDDNKPLMLDICENGIKHVTWEMTSKKVGAKFFAEHSVAELSTWTDFALEDAGRLTEPMVYDPATDHYVPISWNDAFELVGRELRALQSPDEASFYTSGRLSNEATFLYQLWVREFGTNNMPDCSNMCHEASGRALQAAIGTGKGTCDLEDWEETDFLMVMGVNAASNAPRMLTALAEATRRGAQVIHVNTLVESGSTRTIVPHEMVDMALFKATSTSTGNLQVRPGGDFALLRAIAKGTLEAAEYDPMAIDHEFLKQHTQGFEEYRAVVEASSWDELARQSGLTVQQLKETANAYLGSSRAVISWCLGVTQHENSVEAIREIVNVLLLRGNIGRPGAGPSPVRGHSNVQGNRTCGIDNKPNQDFLTRLGEVCDFEPPRADGLDTVGTIKAMHDGSVKVFVAMGGNFTTAAPDTVYTAAALENCELTVQVSTKLNRSHTVHGKKALILPCLGRTEVDEQECGPQGITTEDAMSIVHLSEGRRKPGSPLQKSEPWILAGMAKATLPASKTRWDWYVADYDRIRDLMGEVLPGFEDCNRLSRQKFGFRIPQPARERVFLTKSGKAEFSHTPLPNVIPDDPDMLILQTMRSHDQWNTTIYSNNDRYRGIKNIREFVFLNPEDMKRRGLTEGQFVDITSVSKDGSERTVRKYRVLHYNTPVGSAAGYMPELNLLLGPDDYSLQSDQPLMKEIRVFVRPSA